MLSAIGLAATNVVVIFHQILDIDLLIGNSCYHHHVQSLDPTAKVFPWTSHTCSLMKN